MIHKVLFVPVLKPVMLVTRNGEDLGEDTITVSQAVPTLQAIKRNRKCLVSCFPDVKSVKGKQWIQQIHCDPGTNFVVHASTKILLSVFFLSPFIFYRIPSTFHISLESKVSVINITKGIAAIKTKCLEQSSCSITKFLKSFPMLNDSAEFDSSIEFLSILEDSLELQ